MSLHHDVLSELRARQGAPRRGCAAGTATDPAADRVAAIVGSWRFILIQSALPCGVDRHQRDARRARCGLLVAGAYGRPRLYELALGGTTHALVNAEDRLHLLLAH